MQRTVSSLLALLAFAGGAWGIYDDPSGCPRMSIKASVDLAVRPGQIVTYKIRVTNHGRATVQNLFIDAELPPYVEYPAPPKRVGWGQQSYSIAPKGLANDGVADLGTTIELENVTLPPRKSVTFKVRAKAQDCVPETAKTTIPFEAQAYLIPTVGAAQTCFINAKPSNVTIKGSTRKSQTCPPNVIPGAPLGAAETTPGIATATTLALAPEETYIAPNTPEQDEVRAQQRAAKAAWSLNSDVGAPDYVDDPVLEGSSVDEMQATAALNAIYTTDGITNAPGVYGYTPPDPSHAVGLSHIVVMVNSRLAIYDKATGGLIMGAKNTNTIFAGLPTGDPCRNRNDGDPIAIWDNFNNRFVVSQFTATSPYHQCIAVSQTADPTGSWWLYSIPLSSSQLYDYPKLAQINDAYVITYNRFTSSYVGGAIMLLESPKMAAGLAPKVFMWTTTTQWPVYGYSMLPGGTDNVRGPPPMGSAVPIVALAGTSLYIMKMTWDYAGNTASIYGATSPWVLRPASFNRLCPRGACVVQQSSNRRLDGLGDRLMNRLVYNHFGAYDSMVVTHSITTGVRWYEIRNINTGGIGGTPVLFQQGTIASPSSRTRWFGTAAMDKNGGIGVGYAESGSNLNPSIGIIGREAASPAGTMPHGPTLVAQGQGALTCTCSRYGDYASMQVDPVDGCSFYLYHEYVPVAGTSDRGWGTKIVKFKLPGCV